MTETLIGLNGPYFKIIDGEERRTCQQTHRLHTVFIHAHAVTIFQFAGTMVKSVVNRQVAIAQEDAIRLNKHGTWLGR